MSNQHLFVPIHPIEASLNSTFNLKETFTGLVQNSPLGLKVSVALILVTALAILVKNKVQQTLLTCLFLSRAYDLVTSKLRASTRNAFSFVIFNLPITAVKGKEARKAFFEDRNLSNTEGYRIFGGPNAVSKVDENHVHPDKDEHLVRFMMRITDLVHKDRYADAMPALFDSVANLMNTWGSQGIMDPFNNIYDVTLQVNVHMATCRELSSNITALSEFKTHFLKVETNAHPNSVVFPWFFRSFTRSKQASYMALNSTLSNYVETRRQASVPNSDAIDMLLAQGVSTPEIVLLSLGSIFAGVSNTSKTAIWLLIYVSMHPEWKAAIHAELEPLVSQYGNAADPIHKRLAAIPISVWESSMPTIDLVMRETMRLVINHTALRRNVGETFNMAGGVGEIKRGSFLAYTLADAHLDPSVYPSPHSFDPERFRPGREEDPSAFLGFGAGRHRCLASKLAKLEIKSIIALFMMNYEYEVVNAKGDFPKSVPVPDYNDIQLARPKDEGCFLRFKRTNDFGCQ